MRSRALLLFVMIMLVLPVQAFTAVCFQSQGINAGRTDHIKVTISSTAEEFFSLVGEALRVSCSGSTESAPLTGAGHMKGANAHFSLFLGGTSSCFPITITGTLNSPAFNTGSGTIDIPSEGSFDDSNFTPIACPGTFPQHAGPKTPDR